MNAWSIITLHSPTPSILWRWTLQLLMRHHLAIITHGVFIDARRRQKPQPSHHNGNENDNFSPQSDNGQSNTQFSQGSKASSRAETIRSRLKHHVFVVVGVEMRSAISIIGWYLISNILNLIHMVKIHNFFITRILSPPLTIKVLCQAFFADNIVM